MSSSIILLPWWSCGRSWTAWWISRACPNRRPTWDFAASWRTLKVPPPSWSLWTCLSWKDGPAETPGHGRDTCTCTETLLPLWGLWVPRKILCWWAWSWNRCSSAPCMRCLPSHTTCNQITSNRAPMDMMNTWDTEIMLVKKWRTWCTHETFIRHEQLSIANNRHEVMAPILLITLVSFVPRLKVLWEERCNLWLLTDSQVTKESHWIQPTAVCFLNLFKVMKFRELAPMLLYLDFTGQQLPVTFLSLIFKRSSDTKVSITTRVRPTWKRLANGFRVLEIKLILGNCVIKHPT